MTSERVIKVRDRLIEGDKIITKAMVIKVTNTGKQKEIIFEREGKRETIIAEDILVATGVIGIYEGHRFREDWGRDRKGLPDKGK